MTALSAGIETEIIDVRAAMANSAAITTTSHRWRQIARAVEADETDFGVEYGFMRLRNPAKNDTSASFLLYQGQMLLSIDSHRKSPITKPDKEFPRADRFLHAVKVIGWLLQTIVQARISFTTSP